MSDDAYARQHRGDRGAYDRYLAGMDASMRQKVALTAAHLLCEGRVADMGMGSGSGSHALASLYPALDVVGVDVDATMVAIARERYDLPNLSFEVGDIATQVFERDALDGIFDSSVLHHVTSFGGYDRAAAARALTVQVRQLASRGVLIVRDFVDPGPGVVLLDVPDTDGDDTDDPRSCSTAALFERFAGEFRSLANRRGFRYDRLAAPRPGWRRYRLSHTHAIEFVLRKDYRRDWESEAQEEYTYATQDQLEALFARLGLRVLASMPIRNPWIVRHRFRDKFALRDADGAELEAPATNYIIVGERVPAGEGVRFVEGPAADPVGFLELEYYRHRAKGYVMDLAYRPNRTVDVLPWFDADGDVFVLARRSYPRPVLQAARRGSQPLDGARAVGYVTEPLCAIEGERPLGQTVEGLLVDCAGIAPERIRRMRAGSTYYPSPGGVQEEVRSMFAEVDPVFVERRIDNRSGFSTSGQVRAIEVRQLLRAAQVGGLPDARLELNAYALLLQLSRRAGPWIGEAIDLGGSDGAAPTTMAELAARSPRRAFERVPAAHSAGFMDLRCAEFREVDAAGNIVSRGVREYVAPRPLSINTVCVALVRAVGNEVLFGMVDRDLPASQAFDGNSALLVAPAWRLPADVESTTPARHWIRARLQSEHGLECGDTWELGGRYHPSAGVTPEVVYPIAVEVMRSAANASKPVIWVSLRDAIEHLDAVVDGHTRIAALRAAHALGTLP